jgi:hypothetical protein
MGRELVIAAGLALGHCVLAGCDGGGPTGFTVPADCHGEGVAIEITGLAEGGRRQLEYGPQGGQHVYPRLVLRGVDPQTASVRIQVTRELDGELAADQVFNRFRAGEGRCDVVVPDSPLFVQSPLTDGLPTSWRVTVFDPPQSETLEVTGVCVSSTGPCGPYPALIVLDGTHVLGEDARPVPVSDELRLTLGPGPIGTVWGHVGETLIEQPSTDPILVPARTGDVLDVALVHSRTGPSGNGVFAMIEATWTAGP